MVELTVRHRSHWSRCGDVWVGMWFPGVWCHLVEKNAEKQTAVFLPWTQAERRVTVTAVDYLTEDGNGMDWVSDDRKIVW